MFCLAPTTLIFVTSLLIFAFSNHRCSKCCRGYRESQFYVMCHGRLSSFGPQNVAVVPAILKMRNCVISLRPLLSSTSFKNDSNYEHSWSGGFFPTNCFSNKGSSRLIESTGAWDFHTVPKVCRLRCTDALLLYV